MVDGDAGFDRGGGQHRSVAVLDSEAPPAIAFIRSLGRAGVPLRVYSHRPHSPAAWSRYSATVRPGPDPLSTDEAIDWLSDRMESGEIDLVAPTSDYVAYIAAEAARRVRRDLPGFASLNELCDVLLKPRFAEACGAVGLPTPQTAAPASLDDAIRDAAAIGYPLVMKPRSHIGVGYDRGGIIADESQLRDVFRASEISAGHEAIYVHDPDIGLPLLQKFLPLDRCDIISVSGVIDESRAATSLSFSKKLAQWPPLVGIGISFEAIEPPPYAADVADVVGKVLGAGIFELELCVDRSTGEYWAIDLNPRAFGQIALDIARGSDLPRRWYEMAAGVTLPTASRRRRPPQFWRSGTPYLAALGVHLVLGPDRAAALRDALHQRRRGVVGATFDWRDPGPAMRLSATLLRHPGSLIKPAVKARRSRSRP